MTTYFLNLWKSSLKLFQRKKGKYYYDCVLRIFESVLAVESFAVLLTGVDNVIFGWQKNRNLSLKEKCDFGNSLPALFPLCSSYVKQTCSIIVSVLLDYTGNQLKNVESNW